MNMRFKRIRAIAVTLCSVAVTLCMLFALLPVTVSPIKVYADEDYGFPSMIEEMAGCEFSVSVSGTTWTENLNPNHCYIVAPMEKDDSFSISYELSVEDIFGDDDPVVYNGRNEITADYDLTIEDLANDPGWSDNGYTDGVVRIQHTTAGDKITAVKAGKTLIRIAVEDYGDVLGEAYLAIRAVEANIAVTELNLNHDAITLKNGESTLNWNAESRLQATISPENATNPSINWTSSDESVAKVNPDYQNGSIGIINASHIGTAMIRATSAADGTIYDECVVTVKAWRIPHDLSPKPDADVVVKQNGTTLPNWADNATTKKHYGEITIYGGPSTSLDYSGPQPYIADVDRNTLTLSTEGLTDVQVVGEGEYSDADTVAVSRVGKTDNFTVRGLKEGNALVKVSVGDKVGYVAVTVLAPSPIPISATVTFKVVNGSWDDMTTNNKTVTLTGDKGDTLKLAANQIPTVGTKPNANYKAGSWDVTPNTETAIIGSTTYTYTYAKEGEPPVIKVTAGGGETHRVKKDGALNFTFVYVGHNSDTYQAFLDAGKVVSVSGKNYSNTLTKDTEYKAGDGSLKLTLTKDFLDTLKPGDYTVTVKFKISGSVYESSSTFKIASSGGSNNPGTGEGIMNSVFAMILFLLSLSLIVCGIYSSKSVRSKA